MEVLVYGPSVKHLEGQFQQPIFPRDVQCADCESVFRITSTDDITFYNDSKRNDIRWSCPLCGEAYQQYSTDKYTADQLRTIYREQYQEKIQDAHWLIRWTAKLFGDGPY